MKQAEQTVEELERALGERVEALQAACAGLEAKELHASGASDLPACEAMAKVQAAARGVADAQDDLQAAGGDVPGAQRARVLPALQESLGAATLRLAKLLYGVPQGRAADGSARWRDWLRGRTQDARRAHHALLSLADRALRTAEDEEVEALLPAITAAFDEYEPKQVVVNEGLPSEYSYPAWWQHPASLQLTCLALLCGLRAAGRLPSSPGEAGVGRLFAPAPDGRLVLRERFVRRLVAWADGVVEDSPPDAGEEGDEAEQDRPLDLRRSVASCHAADRDLAVRLLADLAQAGPDRKVMACLARAAAAHSTVRTVGTGSESKLGETPGTRSLALEGWLRRLLHARDGAIAAAGGRAAPPADVVQAMAAELPAPAGEERALKKADADGLRTFVSDFHDDADVLGRRYADEAKEGEAGDVARALWFAFEAHVEPANVLEPPAKDPWYRPLPAAPGGKGFVPRTLTTWFLDQAHAWHARRQLHVALARPDAPLDALEADYRKLALPDAWWKGVPDAELRAAAFRDALFTAVEPLTRHASPLARRAALRLFAAAREPRMLPALVRGVTDADEAARAVARAAAGALVPEDPKAKVDWFEPPADRWEPKRWPRPVGPLLAAETALEPRWKAPSPPRDERGPLLESIRAALLQAIVEPFAPADTARFAGQTLALRAVKRLGLRLRGPDERRALLFGLRHPDPELHDWVADTLGCVGKEACTSAVYRTPLPHKAPLLERAGAYAFPDPTKLPGAPGETKDAAEPTWSRPFAAAWLDATFRRDVVAALTLRLTGWGVARPALEARFPAAQLDRTAWLDVSLLVLLAGEGALPVLEQVVTDAAQPASLRAFCVPDLAGFAPPTRTWAAAEVVLAAATDDAPQVLEGEVLHFLIQEGDRQGGRVHRSEVRAALDAMTAFHARATGPAREWLSDEAQGARRYGVLRRFRALAELDTPAERVREQVKLLARQDREAATPAGKVQALPALECKVGGKALKLSFGEALRLAGAEGGPPESVSAREEVDWLLGCAVGEGLTDAEVAWLLSRVVPDGPRTAAHLTQAEAVALLHDWLRPVRFEPWEAAHLAHALARLLSDARERDAGLFGALTLAVAPTGTPAGGEALRDRGRTARALWALARRGLPELTPAPPWALTDQTHLRLALADLLDPLVTRPGLLGPDAGGVDEQEGRVQATTLHHATWTLARLYAQDTSERQAALAKRLEDAWRGALGKGNPSHEVEGVHWLSDVALLHDEGSILHIASEKVHALAARRLRDSEVAAARLAAVAVRSGVASLLDAAARFRGAQVKLLREEHDLSSLKALGSVLESDRHMAHHLLKQGLDLGKVKLSSGEVAKFGEKLGEWLACIERFRACGEDYFGRVALVLGSREAQEALLELPATTPAPGDAAAHREGTAEDLCQVLEAAAAYERTSLALEQAEKSLGVRFGRAPARRAWKALLSEAGRSLLEGGSGHPLFQALTEGRPWPAEREKPPAGKVLRQVIDELEDTSTTIDRVATGAEWTYLGVWKTQVTLSGWFSAATKRKGTGLLSSRAGSFRRHVETMRRFETAGKTLEAVEIGIEFLETYDAFQDPEKDGKARTVQAIKSTAMFAEFALDSKPVKDLLKGNKKADALGKGAGKAAGFVVAMIEARQQLDEIDSLIEKATAADTPMWDSDYGDLKREVGIRSLECLGHLAKMCEILPGGVGKALGVCGDVCIAGAQALDFLTEVFGANHHEKVADYLGYDWLYWWESRD